MTIVEGVYRVLGVIAPINQRLGRYRVNLVPINIALIIALGALSIINWTSVVRVLQSRRAREPQTVNAILSTTRFSGAYVFVHGRLMGNSRLTYGQRGASGKLQLSDYTWAPIVDEASRQGMLVQFRAEHEFPANGAAMTIEGMMRPVNSAVARQLKEIKYVHDGIPIDRRFVLVAGEKPGSLGGPLMTGTIFGLVVIGLVWSTLTRNVIFLPTDSALSGTAVSLDNASGETLLVSGTLALDAKTRRFFTNMPAIVHRMESGDTALLSHIETSRTVMGLKRKEHSGVWMLGIRPGSMTEAQPGHVFWGFKKRRATRFRYVNALTGKSERAVVARVRESTEPAYVATKATVA